MYSYISHHIDPDTEITNKGYWNEVTGRASTYVKVTNVETDVGIIARPADLRRLAAACIEAAEKGEALELEHAPVAAE